MSQTSGRRFDVKGRNIQIKLVPNGDQLAVSDATIERQAHLEELTERPGEKPLVVAGDRLIVKSANAEDTRVTVTGNPGRLAAAGMTLEGGAIEMQRNIDRLWIDGPGRMTMPMTQDLNGRPIERPQLLTVIGRAAWTFSPTRSSSRRTSRAQSGHQLLNTGKLAGGAQPPDRLCQSARSRTARNRPIVRNLPRCVVTVRRVLKSREFDERNVQTSFDLMHAFDLGIDQVTRRHRRPRPGHHHARRPRHEPGDRRPQLGADQRRAAPTARRPAIN